MEDTRIAANIFLNPTNYELAVDLLMRQGANCPER
jgi:hypothetical protein